MRMARRVARVSPAAPIVLCERTFEECIEFIEEAINGGGRVVVHCAAGISRSGTIVIAYMMWKNKWRRDQALEFVISKRPLTQPNKGFLQ